MARFWNRRAVLVTSAAAAVAAAFVAQPMVGTGTASPLPSARSGGRADETVVLILRGACPPVTSDPDEAGGAPSCPAQAPVLRELRQGKAKVLSTTQLIDTITARVTPAQEAALRAQAGVAQIVPDSAIPLGTAPATARTLEKQSTEAPKARAGSLATTSHPKSFPGCGTKSDPAIGPEALAQINDSPVLAMGIDGAGVTVATLADGVNPDNADFVRNKAYGPAGQRVIAQYLDYSGDGTKAVTEGGEAFGDDSTIAAQGNTAYNLSDYVNPAQAARLPQGGCWIKIVGAAPGVTIESLKVIAQTDEGSTSGVLEAIQHAVSSGAKVINESFGSQNFPDTSMDVVREADDAAVDAGVTVVVSSGDAGVTSTIGSPASDPGVISVGATTDFRSYAQSNLGGFVNPVTGNGKWADNNIASFTSGGYTQTGGTVDLVAPGDSDWELCSTNPKIYTYCADILGGRDIGVQMFGGTSEAAPLTTAAAALVIEAYARTHGGTDPTPALVKEILTSTATDIDAPADQQGAGLLNVLGAVKLAQSLPAPAPTPTTTTTTSSVSSTTTSSVSSTTTAATAHVVINARQTATSATPGAATGVGAPTGNLLISPNQIDLSRGPGTVITQQISLTNTGHSARTVRLTTRALTDQVYSTGTRTFTLDPASPTTNMGTFPIWSGVKEVYQAEKFNVPAVAGGRLIFEADYQDTGQSSDLHVALFEPNGTFANYSEPQGLGDYAEMEVTEPPAGTWTALFFTVENGATKGATGTNGPVQWDASVWRYAKGGTITPSSVNVAPGKTVTATFSVRTPVTAGDNDQSIVVTSAGTRTTVPVTLRTTVPIGTTGGSFSGILTGGNGREGAQAQSNTYQFDVPAGKTDLDASVALSTDPDEVLFGYLVDPSGQAVAFATNDTLVPTGSSFYPTQASSNQVEPGATPYVQMYVAAPEAGEWLMVLEWANPVTGNELAEHFEGAIRFDQVRVTAKGVPDSSATELSQGQGHSFVVTIRNTGVAPDAYFLDPRLDRLAAVPLANQNPSVVARNFSLPLLAGLTFPIYLVPTNTTELSATLTRLSGPDAVSFDMEYASGDPDVSPAEAQTGTTSTNTASSTTLTLAEPDLSQGLWVLDPAEVGPYPATGAPTDTVSVQVTAMTQAFDNTVTSGTDDFWKKGFSFSHFRYLQPDQSTAITVTIKPNAAVGTHVTGTLYVDDFTMAAFYNSVETLSPDADELAAIPYSYTVSAP